MPKMVNSPVIIKSLSTHSGNSCAVFNSRPKQEYLRLDDRIALLICNRAADCGVRTKMKYQMLRIHIGPYCDGTRNWYPSLSFVGCENGAVVGIPTMTYTLRYAAEGVLLFHP